MQFEWDEQKNKENIHKHGVDFLDASRVFYDPHRQTRRDRESPIGEERFQTVGMTDNGLLFVVYVERIEDLIRVISARKARSKEKRDYADGTFED